MISSSDKNSFSILSAIATKSAALSRSSSPSSVSEMLKDAYAEMVKDSKYADNKELLLIPDAVHTDLYDGGGKNAIPFDKLEEFFGKNMK